MVPDPVDAGATLSRRLAPFFDRLARGRLGPWQRRLAALAAARLHPARHGDLPRWQAALEALPALPGGHARLDTACVGVVSAVPPAPVQRAALVQGLEALHPWRKGPFCLHGVRLDAEWRSDWKWARLAGAVAPLHGRLVIDIGCGNGYYGYRALGAGAALVLGIDPALRFVAQFLALHHCIGDSRLGVLPLADTDLPGDLTGADTVLSMGVLYHRRDAAAHLAALRRLLRPGGELVLETLILDAPGQRVLVPPGRYARMRNVHALPTLAALRDWLHGAGLRRVRVVDVTRTTPDEQRRTRWMRFQSLADFLDPADPGRTIEGHPAPTRALLLAER
jgi:tRNA (mo5U34)-methyltransferase